MKYISSLGTLVLIAVLSACGSGSSNEPDASTSTNTVPPENNITDSDTTSEPSEAGEASEDQPTTADDTENADGSDDSDSETGGDGEPEATTDGDSDDSSTDGEGEPEASTDGGSDDSSNTSDDGDDQADGGGADIDDDTDADGGTDVDGETSGDADTGEGSDTSGSSDTGESNSDDPVIDPDSALGQIQSRIKFLTGRTLLALNQSLSQGEMLSAQQEQCLGTYDPAIGGPLLAIECEQPLATGEVEIFASVASFKDTSKCRTSLQDANANACAVDQAQMLARPIFTVPETGTPQLKQAGAMLSYNIVQDRLTLENLGPALTGTFFCEYDLSNGNAVDGDPGGNCFDQLTRIADLIDEHLAAEQ